MDTLRPDILATLLQYRGFPLSEVENVPAETKIYVLIMEVFSIVSLIRRVREVPL